MVGIFSDIGKKAKDLLTKDDASDQKFSVSTPSGPGVAITSTALKKGGLSTGDVATVKKGKKGKKELLSSAPWRINDSNSTDEFPNAKLRVTSQPGGDSTMYVPGKKTSHHDHDDNEDASPIDSELRYTFQRNFQFIQQVFTVDTLVKPLPPKPAYYVSRSLDFFTSIFTQFFDPEGIAKAQKSLGIGEETRVRRVR